MKKVFLIPLIATMLFSVGVINDVWAKKVADMEMPKIEKSYSVTVWEVIPNTVFCVCQTLFVQGDVFYLEQTVYGNYILPEFEEVYIEPDSPVPLQTV